MKSEVGNYVVHTCHVSARMPLVTEPYRLCWVELILRAVHHKSRSLVTCAMPSRVLRLVPIQLIYQIRCMALADASGSQAWARAFCRRSEATDN